MTQVKAKEPAKKRISFSLEAPQADSVFVSGSFCDWRTDAHPLKKDKRGVWKATVSLPLGRHEYRFVVDGNWRDDPECPERVANSYGTENCVLHVLREVVQRGRSRVADAQIP